MTSEFAKLIQDDSVVCASEHTLVKDCTKDIRSHTRQFKLTCCISSETDLILARGRIYKNQADYHNVNICSAHRSAFGVYWRPSTKNCSLLHTHPKTADRTVNVAQAQALETLDVHTQIGTG